MLAHGVVRTSAVFVWFAPPPTVTSRMRRILAGARRWLRREPDEPPFRPDLSDAAFLARLAAQVPAFGRASASHAAGDVDGARTEVVAYFLARERPAFFCRPSEVQALAARLRRERPAAVAALRVRVQADRVQGLRVVSRRDAPLDEGIGWCGIAPGPGADDLYAAQPHRFGFLPRLAIAALHGDNTVPLIARLLSTWTDAVAAGEPECYHSPLAVLYRVLACSWALVLVGGGDAPEPLRNEVVFTLLKILAADRDYLQPTIGQSYPNNHLLADGFAAWYVGLLFPEFGDAESLRARGDALFVQELRRQFFADGGNFEHSTHYHELGCEMASAYVLLARRNGQALPEDLPQRLHTMLAFQAAVGGPEARPLPLGDTTEDPLFPLDADHGWANAAMRELLRALHEPELAAAPAADATVERAYWLLGGALAPPPIAPAPEVTRHFDDAGVHVLVDTALGSRLVFRAGPMQDRLLSAGHAHADLLSLHLNIGDRPIVVNSGTGTYRAAGPRWNDGSPDWRHYFAGPRSHNGVFLGIDPFGPMTGDFRNRDVPCRVRPLHRAAGPGITCMAFEVLAPHAAGGLCRWVVQVDGLGWLIEDGWRDGPDRAASFGLQFAPGVAVDVAAGTPVIATLDDVGCRIDFEPAWEGATVLCGSVQPLGGWISPRYGERIAAPQLRAVAAAGRRRAATLLRPTVGAVDDAVEWHRDAAGVALRLQRGGETIVIALGDPQAGTAFRPWGLEAGSGASCWRRDGASWVELCRA